MASQAFILTPDTTPKGRVKKNEFRTMIPDLAMLGETVQKIAAVEIQKQIKIGNQPKNLIVDNKDHKPFNKATFRVTALFADSKQIALATLGVIKELQKVTRRKTSAAAMSYQVWVVKDRNDPGKLVDPYAGMGSVSRLEKIAATLPPTGRLVVVGPTVDYGRKLYWNPKSSRNLKGRARYSAAYDINTGKLRRVRVGGVDSRDTNMRDLVVGRLRRRFPSTSIVGRWVQGRTVNGDNRWPGIGIGLRTKGYFL